MVTMTEQKTSNINSGGGVLTYWVKAAPEASLQAVETEVASLKKSVSDGKTLVAGAITDKGITTATDAAFATMADNISQISTLAVDTADATATAAQILTGKRAYVKGAPVVGTMPNNGGVSAAISSGSLKAGYTTGGAIANLVASNVKKGVNIGGVVGNLMEDGPISGMMNMYTDSVLVSGYTYQADPQTKYFTLPKKAKGYYNINFADQGILSNTKIMLVESYPLNLSSKASTLKLSTSDGINFTLTLTKSFTDSTWRANEGWGVIY